jgi:hypothetical protein
MKMKITWRLYLDIYDIESRKDLASIDLDTGSITKQDEIKELFSKLEQALPKDANYFKDPISTIRTKSLTLESPLCFSSKDGSQRNSPGLILEPSSDVPSIIDLQTMILEYTKALP